MRMRTLAGVPMLIFSAPALAAVLWSNYLSPAGYDGRAGLSSERATLTNESWTADDVVLEVQSRLTAIRWIGFREPGMSFPAADFLILNDSFQVVADGTSFPYSATVIGSDFGMETYEGSVALPPIVLEPGRYYISARLVDEGLGRNFLATTGEGQLAGESFGVFRSAFFGFPEWSPAAAALESDPSEFALVLEGNILCSGTLRGDSNGDGNVNNFDIDAFVLAISQPDVYLAEFCEGSVACWRCRNDLNNDNFANNFDIDAFVACLGLSLPPGEGCP
jgi:hypothetical protein